MKNEPRYVIIASNEPKPMGETLLDYARPLIQQLPHDHTLEELKAVVIFAAVLWSVQRRLARRRASPHANDGNRVRFRAVLRP